MNKIILFDGECNFCDHTVQFIIKRDPSGVFKFASLQSKIGQELLETLQVSNSLDSFILVDNDSYFQRSTAALRVSRDLKGAWKLIYVLIVIPSPIRDFFYNIFAKNRYKCFGKKEECMLPTPDIRKRFL